MNSSLPEWRRFWLAHRLMRRPERATFAALLGLAVLVLVMFGDLLLGSNGRVVSAPGNDLTSGEADGRAYVWGELRKGRLPLWNTQLLSGTPCLPEAQSATLYPLNLLYLALPFETAINLHVALHVWLLGAGLFFWTRNRGLQPLSCFVAGVLVMFSGPFFLHIHAGHLNNLAAMAWAPILLLASDWIGSGKARRGVLLGASALALQVLSGQPQYVYYTCISVLLYATVRLVHIEGRVRFLAAHALMTGSAIALAAAQLFPSFATLPETVRSGHTPSYEFAAMFSFPPENLLTLIAPAFFGNMGSVPYWGRCYLWEMCLFVGVTGLVLAIRGACCRGRESCVCLVMIGLLAVLALGSHTPLFPVLFRWAPLFDSLRGTSKFAFQAILFVGMLSAFGLDSLRSAQREKAFGFAIAIGAAVLVLAGLVLEFAAGQGPAGLLGKAGASILATRESYLPEPIYADAAFVRGSADLAARSLWIAAGVLIATGAAMWLPVSTDWRTRSVALIAVIEIFAFARTFRTSFDLNAYRSAAGLIALKEFAAKQSGDFRVLQLFEPNSALFTGLQNIWAYGAIPLRRYVEFIAFTQDQPPDTPMQALQFRKLSPLFSMLRCRFALLRGKDEIKIVNMPEAMERVTLIHDFEVVNGRDAVFRAMAAADFDPRRKVILEQEPNPGPTKSETLGTASITASGPDFLEIEAELPSSAILLVTDAFSTDWRVRSLAASPQSRYEILPANHILRAIPLAAGRHRLRMEYIPRGLSPGAWISGIGWLGWLGGVLILARKSGQTVTRPVRGLSKSAGSKTGPRK
jgi:hypothetical protein